MAEDPTPYLRDLWCHSPVIAMKARMSAGVMGLRGAAGNIHVPDVSSQRTVSRWNTHAGTWAADVGPLGLFSAGAAVLAAPLLPASEECLMWTALGSVLSVLLGFGISAYALHTAWAAKGPARRGFSPLAALVLQPVVLVVGACSGMESGALEGVLLGTLAIGHGYVVVAIGGTWRQVVLGALSATAFLLGLAVADVPFLASGAGLIGMAYWVRLSHQGAFSSTAGP